MNEAKNGNELILKSMESMDNIQQGKGFAVVADVVRKLVEESKVSASKMMTIIYDIHDSTETVIHFMINGQGEVGFGLQTVNEASQIFEKIFKSD